MANEATLRDRLEHPIDFTVADGVGIEKGAICGLFDPRLASGSIAAGAPCAGIAAREKVASDGRTRLAMFRRGIFDMYATGAIALGQNVVAGGVGNEVKADGLASGAVVIGHALETAATGETFQVYVNVGG